MKDFDKWNEVKKDTEINTRKIGIKPREIFWAKLGENVGFEKGWETRQSHFHIRPRQH